jgi:hypothetical protein
MAAIITTLTNAITYLNALYEGDTDAPTSGDDDFTYWTNLLNIAINTWENEEGVLWNSLFCKLSAAADGDKTTAAGDYSYALPTNFRFPASGYVWLGTGSSKTALKVIKQEELTGLENDTGNWCYFTPTTLEINPNLTISAGETISYNYYKYATALSSGTDTFEMSDPMFAVYFTLAELRRDEGDNTSGAIATQKLEAMKTKNVMPTWLQDSFNDLDQEGF